MPLHLLGKKSWNVYNTDNIERVRKDEAIAKAKEEEQERQWQEHEAENRLRVLRGEEPLPVIEEQPKRQSSRSHGSNDGRKRRRLAGEDDTDREIRLAKEDAKEVQDITLLNLGSHVTKREGHSDRKHEEKNEDQPELQGMRFKDVAGYKQDGIKPWYTDVTSTRMLENEPVSRDVWGNEDPRRREREQQRLSSGDPLMAMKKGVKKLREHEKERQAWRQQRERDLNEVEEMARRERRRKRYHDHDSDLDSLGGFDLDKGYDKSKGRARQKHRHHHRHRPLRRSAD